MVDAGTSVAIGVTGVVGRYVAFIPWSTTLVGRFRRLYRGLWSFVEMGPMPKDGFNEVETPGDIAAPVVKRNLLKHLFVRFGLSVEDENLHFQWGPSSVFDVGKPGVVWFSAAAGDGLPRDVYFSQFRVSQAGIPIGMAAPVNVTRTAVGDEHVLDVGLTRVLYSVPQDGRIERVVELDFAPPLVSDGFINTLASGIAGWLEFGHWGGCREEMSCLIGESSMWMVDSSPGKCEFKPMARRLSSSSETAL